ncbi:29375_t:CDS:1, partial [Racocetra persica]
MFEEIKNNTINFFWKNNRNISTIVFEHKLYTAMITLVNNIVKIINLDAPDYNLPNSRNNNNQ